MLAPSAFLASAASTRDLQQSILPEFIRSSPDEAITKLKLHGPPCQCCHPEAKKVKKSIASIAPCMVYKPF